MRRFITTSLQFVIPFTVILGSAAAYLYLYIKPDPVGELATLGCFTVNGSREYTKEIKERWRPTKFAPRLFGSQTDATVVNIGDSFTGLAPSYIDFCASNSKLGIYSMSHIGLDLFNYASSMVNNGTFKRLNTKFVILESVERYLFQRIEQLDLECDQIPKMLAMQLDVKSKAEVDSLPNSFYYQAPKQKTTIKELINWILVLTKKSPVPKVTLDKPLFSLEETNLYFYQDDLFHSCLNHEQLQLVESKLNILYDKFKSQGIELIVLCIPDKFHTYQDHIVNNPYPRSCTGEQVAQLDLHGKFLYPSEMLAKLVNDGVKDVYFIDDAHWSPIAGKPFGEELAGMLSTYNLPTKPR